MTEQFAFQEIKGNSRAIQLDECTPASRACFVNGLGNQFLAGAGFAVNQNGRVGGCNTSDLFKHRFKRTARPDNLLKCTRGLVLVTVCNCFGTVHSKPPQGCTFWQPSVGCLHVDCGAHFRKQNLIVERFHKEFDRALSHCLHPHFRVSMCGDKNDRSFTSVGLNPRLQIQT